MSNSVFSTPLTEAQHYQADGLLKDYSLLLPEAFAELYEPELGGPSSITHIKNDLLRGVRTAKTVEQLCDAVNTLFAERLRPEQMIDYLPHYAEKPKPSLSEPDALDAYREMCNFVLMHAMARAQVAGIKPEALAERFDTADFKPALIEFRTHNIQNENCLLPTALLEVHARLQAAKQLHDAGQWQAIRLPENAPGHFNGVMVEANKNLGFHDGHLHRQTDFSEPTLIKQARVNGYMEIARHAQTLGELAATVRYAEMDAATKKRGHLTDFETNEIRKRFNWLCEKELGIPAPDISGIAEEEARHTFSVLKNKVPDGKMQEIMGYEKNAARNMLEAMHADEF